VTNISAIVDGIAFAHSTVRHAKSGALRRHTINSCLCEMGGDGESDATGSAKGRMVSDYGGSLGNPTNGFGIVRHRDLPVLVGRKVFAYQAMIPN
jgi:hypothetical protein